MICNRQKVDPADSKSDTPVHYPIYVDYEE